MTDNTRIKYLPSHFLNVCIFYSARERLLLNVGLPQFTWSLPLMHESRPVFFELSRSFRHLAFCRSRHLWIYLDPTESHRQAGKMSSTCAWVCWLQHRGACALHSLCLLPGLWRTHWITAAVPNEKERYIWVTAWQARWPKRNMNSLKVWFHLVLQVCFCLVFSC